MNANADRPTADDGMPQEIDFSKGTRGRFYRAEARLILPAYLEADVANELARSAEKEGIDVTAFVARLLEEPRLAANDAPASARP